MIRQFFLLSAVLPLVAASPASAQEEQPLSPPPAAIFSPDRPFDPAAATQAWLAAVPAEERAKSDAYFEGGYWLILWNFLVTIAVTLVLLISRISARMRDIAERMTRFKALQVALYAIQFILVIALLTFTSNLYQNFFREHAYGLATQTFGPWLIEQIEALIIVLISGSIALVILYAVFRRFPRTWWIWGTIVAVCLSMFQSFIDPVLVEPIFNKYKPLSNPAIKEPILAMARANEIPVTQVFEVDASRQTTRISANVAGFLGTTRIALNDNLLKQCTLPEIREVMGHEMAHYILNHNLKLVTYSAIFFLIASAFINALFDPAMRKWGDRWDVRGIGDPAGLPLLCLFASAFFFVMTPFINTAVRVTEREADAFGINTSRESDGMAKVALKLAAYRKLDPSPIEEFIFYDHPSGRARIRMAMDWKAAQLPCGDVNPAKSSQH